MIRLRLTEELKNKLLEMANAYFKEYNFKSSFLDCIHWTPKDNPIYTDYVHYFEFVTGALAQKILNPNNENDFATIERFKNFLMQTNDYIWFQQDPGMRESFTINPIEYLYNIYKK